MAQSYIAEPVACSVCGETFMRAYPSNSGVCSDECRKERRREYARRWASENPERMAEYRRRWRSKLPNVTPRGTAPPSYSQSAIRSREWKAKPGNRELNNARTRERRAQMSPEERREIKFRHHCHQYGISVADYYAMLEAQGHRCAICQATEPNGHNWHIDHCHSSGKVRGLLCSGCNVGLGHFADDTERMLRAIEYVRHHART